MNFVSSKQIDSSCVSSVNWDVAIAASGFERRSSHLVREFEISAKKKIAFGFSNRKCLSRSYNDKTFLRNGFELIEQDGDSSEGITLRLTAEVDRFTGDVFRVLVDYSCMTRAWYASIINFFRRSIGANLRVEIYFCYSHAGFAVPAAASPNSHVGALNGFSSITLPRIPTALIIGLGNEFNRALGIKEYIDPAETFLFFTDPCLDMKFSDSIREANDLLFSMTSEDRVYTYPSIGIQRASALLTSVASALSEKYRLILAPLGPKPFSLLCMLVSLRLQNVEVWRISSGQLAEPFDQVAIGPVTVLRVVFEE